MTMNRSPIKDIEVKYLLNHTLADDINSHEDYTRCISRSCYYDSYTGFKAEELYEYNSIIFSIKEEWYNDNNRSNKRSFEI